MREWFMGWAPIGRRRYCSRWVELVVEDRAEPHKSSSQHPRGDPRPFEHDLCETAPICLVSFVYATLHLWL